LFLSSLALSGCGDSGNGGSRVDAAVLPVVGELVSRTGGVAPLAVFFDAVGTPNVKQPPEVDGRMEYGDLHYEWDFGDPGSGTWAVSGKSKNHATGYVAAHVYETPGTYTVTLTVTDQDGQSESYQAEIVVDDPDVVYSGASTVCVSTGTDFTGCPAGATQVTTDQITEIEQYFTSGGRVLLRRGDVWQTSDTMSVSTEGPFTLGAFGDCQAADERGICSNAPVIQAQGAVEASLFRVHNVSDTRIMDLRLVGPHEFHGALGGVTGISTVLAFRLQVEGFGTPLGNSHWETEGHDQYMYVDCDAGMSATNVIYVGSERLALMGNRFRNPSASHVVRVWQAFKGVISHNDISGSSQDTDAGRHAIKLHGPGEDVISDPGEGGLARRTKYVVISNNIFGGSGPWPVAIGPQDSGSDERLENLVVEQNRFYPGYGDPSCCSSLVQVSLLVWARYVTVRNNVFTGEGSSRYFTAVSIGQRGIEPFPLGNRVFNNTIYKSDPVVGEYNSAAGISVDDVAVGTTVINNLVYFANGFDVVDMIEGGGTDLTEAFNLMTDDPWLVDPDNADFLAKDFSLQADSPAVDNGTPTAVFDDFAGAARPVGGGYDVGAFER
jgi:PKD repeat protein